MGGAPARLTRRRFVEGLDAVVRGDPDLAAVVEQHGPPPMWARPPGFATLLHIILEQQVSLASARACYAKLVALTGPPTPQRMLALSDAELRSVGFSRQKTAYCHNLARAVVDGELPIDRLGRMPDDAVREALIAVSGIGPWTADIYLLMALRRPDVWPPGDLALVAAMAEVKRLRKQPDRARFEKLGRRYAPWRAVAARVLWHHYLSTRES